MAVGGAAPRARAFRYRHPALRFRRRARGLASRHRPGASSARRRTPGSAPACVRRMLDMELDHDSGALAGRVLAGRFAGRSLDDLQAAELMALHARDPRGPGELSLLEAYLDRRTPGWRENFQHDAAARAGGAAAPSRDDEGGSLRGPWGEAGGGGRGNPSRAPDAHEETPSRPGGVDVPRGPGERGQGPSSRKPYLGTPRITQRWALLSEAGGHAGEVPGLQRGAGRLRLASGHRTRRSGRATGAIRSCRRSR